ncbi:MAG: flavodoxin family protein, partial [Spirochaetales bacterium]|nr:flavodoxin family protein [Spirochaetales bacterium]
MIITVINGSPKGEMGVTVQSIKYLQKRYPHVNFIIHNIGKKIKSIEKNPEFLKQIINDIEKSNGVAWIFGVYFELIPYQLKRFIEIIMNETNIQVFRDKYAFSLSTSAHWLDTCAHNYIQAVCDDLCMNYRGFFSAEANDLLIEKERKRLTLFAESFFRAIKFKMPAVRRYPPLQYSQWEYYPSDTSTKIDQGDKSIVVITDCNNRDNNLGRMIAYFKECFVHPIQEVNLRQIKINGGCLACFQCAYDNHCAYEGADDYNKILNEIILPADIIVYAGSIEDRYFSSRMKLYLDRSFVYGHIPIFKGKQMGVIVSGPLSQVTTLREPIENGLDWHQANLAGFVTDEVQNSTLIDKQI